jgi:hypothetical protein
MRRPLSALFLSALFSTIAFAQLDPFSPDSLDDIAHRMAQRRDTQRAAQQGFVPTVAPQLDPPLPPGASDDIARRMAQRRDAAIAATRATQPTTAPTAATQPDPAQWAALLAQLSNDNFQTREAAQRELDKLDYQHLDFLRRAAETTTDLEIKSRLTLHIRALEDELASNPPPISVNLKDASIADLADEFSKALGIKLDPYPPRNQGADANSYYNLSAVNRPFWEVFLTLARQRPFGFYNNGNQTMLSTQTGQNITFGTVNGPLLVYPTSLTRQRNVTFQSPNGPITSPETMSLSCSLILDPRMRVVKYASPQFTEIVDDLGNVLLSQPANQQPTNELSGSRSIALQMSANAGLKVPEKRGTKIASAQGLFRVAVQTADDRLDITDIEKKVGQTFDFAGYPLRLRSYNLTSDSPTSPINVSLYLISDSSGGRVVLAGGGPVASNPPTVTISLLDATGKIVYSTTTRGGTSLSTSGNMTLPLTIRLSAPSKTKDLELPFELKDLPIP